MTNEEKRDKVIDGLKNCGKIGEREVYPCEECPYYTCGCSDQLCRDALALLTEQDEGVTPIESTTEQKKFVDRIGLDVSDFWCGACRFNLVGHPKFCPNCGKKVKWDEL